MARHTPSGIVGTTELDSVSDRGRVEIERQVLFEVLNALNAANLDELLVRVHTSLKKILYADNCYVALHDGESGTFHFPFFVDQFDTPPSPQRAGRGCAAY